MEKKKYLNQNLKKLRNEKIKDINIDDYYIDDKKLCCNFNNLKPYADNIGKFEYHKLVKYIFDNYQNAKYNNFIVDFYEEIKKINEDTLMIPNDNLYLNHLMIYYTQCRPKIKILTLFPSNKINLEDIIKKFKNVDLYASKVIKMNFKSIRNLIYQMYAYTDKYKDIESIEKYIKELGFEKDSKIKIYIFLYEGNDIKIDNSHNTNTFMEALTLSKIYFNQNSLNFLKEQLLERHISDQFKHCKIIFNTFIKYFFTNIELFDIDKFLILSGCVFNTYGIRSCSDIDIIIYDNPTKIVTKDFLKKIENKFLNNDTKLFYADTYTKLINKDKYWKDFWDTEWHLKWANGFGSQHLSETYFNPKFHFYYMGIKMIILDGEIERRNLRNRPASVTDLIMINKLLNKNIKINSIPSKILDGNTNYKEYKVTNKYKFLSTVRHWLKVKYNKYMSIQELENIVKFK